MGEVYRARDRMLQRDVAIKVLPQAGALDPERLARFAREAQILASLNHPNIAQIYGVKDVTGTPALVMELVEGLRLADLIAGRSSDGRWLAYDLTRGGPFQLVMATDGRGARVAVNARGGEAPRWSHDGRQLFFRPDGAVPAVNVDATDGQWPRNPSHSSNSAGVALPQASKMGADFRTLETH